MASRQTEIIQALVSILSTMPEVKTINYDRIKLLASDFSEYELPVLQIIDMAEDSQHEKGRALKTWNISIEIVIGPIAATSYVPTQTDLWDLRELVERKIWADPKLGLSYVIQCLLLGSSTDLHILQPLYTARLDFQIIYYQPLVSYC
jgi:hypothetical protein